MVGFVFVSGLGRRGPWRWHRMLTHSKRYDQRVHEVKDDHNYDDAYYWSQVLGRALEAVSHGITITDPHQSDNPIVYANAAFEHLTGYSAEEVIGRNCRFLQGSEKNQPSLEEVRAAIREERECRVVVRNYRKDGALFSSLEHLCGARRAGRPHPLRGGSHRR